MRLPTLLACAALGACSSEELLPEGRVEVLTGASDDAWQRDPAPTAARAEAIGEGGQRELLAELEVPVDTFGVGRSGTFAVELTATDADGEDVLRGRTLPLSAAGLAGQVVPLLAGRVGEWMQPSDGLRAGQPGQPPAAILGGRRIWLIGGEPSNAVQTDVYDTAYWDSQVAPQLGCPSPPCEFRSVAVVDGTLAIVVGPDFAIWLDFSTDVNGDAPLPTGMSSYEEVSGGRTLTLEDGSALLIGGTRASAETNATLHVATDGALTAPRLAAPRSGAAAAVLPGRGVVVVGGNDEKAGAELFSNAAFTPLPFPPDATRGAGLAPQSDGTVVRAGGTVAGAPADTVRIDAGCSTDCEPERIGDPVPLRDARAFTLRDDRVLVVGSADDGSTRAYRLDPQTGTSEPVPLSAPRTGGTALRLPNGQVAIVGGTRDGALVRAVDVYVD